MTRIATDNIMKITNTRNSEVILCEIHDRVLNLCEETMNAFITAWIPLVENRIVARKMKMRSPFLFSVMTSVRVFSRRENTFSGRRLLNKSNNSAWKFGMGINGINVNKKIIEGSTPNNMLNAMADALVTNEPF